MNKNKISSQGNELQERIRTITKKKLLNQHQLDLFVSAITDVATKSDNHSMEYPFFTLSKKIEKTPKELTVGNYTLKIEPGSEGCATIWDKDILLYCASHITEALNRGETVSRTIRAESYSLLKSTGRGTGGNSYIQLLKALKRIKGTQYSIEEKTPEPGIRRQWKMLDGFIKDATVTEYDDKSRALSVDITLSESFFLALLQHQVLTFNPNYFQLTGGIERRLYEIARKFCGNKKTWSISLSKLQQRVGGGGTLRKFRLILLDFVKGKKTETLPDYCIAYDPALLTEEGGKVTFLLRDTKNS